MFDLTGWELILTYGKSLYVFGKGNRRVAIDYVTARVVTEYDFIEGG